MTGSLSLAATNLIANNSPDFLLRETYNIVNIWFFEWFKFLYSGSEPLVFSFSIKIEVTAVVVKSPQR
ncbi:hypothetical protein [Haloarcula sp. CGMCC 1.2071]|uniref:hypothetical protein n=1 Tax=Haloarcula sp. CGMCC 1.2071 TaxID=3111454 RepID=UPI00300F004F